MGYESGSEVLSEMVGARLYFRFAGFWLILRGVLALVLFLLGGAFLAEPVFSGGLVSAAVYAVFVFGGFGLVFYRRWGLWLSGFGIFAALAVDLLFHNPNWLTDAAGVVLLVAFSERLRQPAI